MDYYTSSYINKSKNPFASLSSFTALGTLMMLVIDYLIPSAYIFTFYSKAKNPFILF